MSNLGGHEELTPCIIPPDPIGYHCEMQESTVTIAANTGTNDLNSHLHAISLFPNPAVQSSQLSYSLAEDKNVTIYLFNTVGQKVMTRANENKYAG